MCIYEMQSLMQTNLTKEAEFAPVNECMLWSIGIFPRNGMQWRSGVDEVAGSLVQS